jgi:hypothetical protein
MYPQKPSIRIELTQALPIYWKTTCWGRRHAQMHLSEPDKSMHRCISEEKRERQMAKAKGKNVQDRLGEELKWEENYNILF